jgi:uncharacterized protein
LVVGYLLAGLLNPAVAQSQTEPLMGSEASPGDAALANAGAGGDAANAGGSYRILVVGDALAGGLGAGMSRVAESRFEILSRFNESSGLARAEVYDWPAAIAKITSTKPVNAIVVLVGMNDRQDIREGNLRHPFKSPGWVSGYTANVDKLVAAAKAANATLYWVSVPPMADAVFDGDMRYISDIHRQRVAAGGQHYVDVRPSFLASDGTYSDRGPDETGVDRKLRSRDGVTFFKQGNNRFGQLVMGAVVALAAPAPAVPETATVAAAPAAQDNNAPQASRQSLPQFGQEGLDGEAVVIAGEALVASATPKPEKQTTAPAGATAAALSVKAGSQAERLLRDGVSAPAPAGRFDDFSVPAEAQ